MRDKRTKKEIEEGCGRWFEEGNHHTQCGYQYRKKTKIHLCAECQLELNQRGGR